MCLRVYRFNESLALAACLLVLACLPTAGSASSPPPDSVHFCALFDYEQWLRDNPAPGRKRAADLNVGPPRTVRMIYFHPNDRPYRQEVVDSMKTLIRRVQTFCTEQMQAHGYGKKTFRFETDAQGAPLVHRVKGQHVASRYPEYSVEAADMIYEDVLQTFNLRANIYLTVVDYVELAGFGYSRGKNGGNAMMGAQWDEDRGSAPRRIDFYTAVHELGHAFGMVWHDPRDDAYIMRGVRQDGVYRFSACAARFLAVHPYFNPDSAAEEIHPPTIELISPTRYPHASKSVSILLKVGDSEGVHEVILRDLNRGWGGSQFEACRGLTGEKETVVEFKYDSLIPSRSIHRFSVGVVDTDGNVVWDLVVLSEISPHQIADVEGHSGSVNSVVFSPDGATFGFGVFARWRHFGFGDIVWDGQAVGCGIT